MDIETAPLVFFLALVVDGVLSGAIYALIALAFVLVYKASRIVNFAIGEWIMFGALVAAAGFHQFGLGLIGALLFGVLGMSLLGVAFNIVVLQRMTTRPVISLIMVMLGLAAVMRGVASFVFAGIPGSIPLPISAEPVRFVGIPLATDKIAAAGIASSCIVLIAWFVRRSRTGIVWRALADDPSAASAAGIDTRRQLSLIWIVTGAIAVIGGVLWTATAGSGFGVALVGLKIFPIVIIGGFDSLGGTVIGAVIVGVLENLGAGYLDPHLGGGFGTIASYLVLLAVLVVRPQGLFGQPRIERV